MSNRYRFTPGTGWGKLFGLSIVDLEEWQLKKIDKNKLVEFVEQDHRVEKIIGDFIFNATSAGDVELIRYLQPDEVIRAKYLLKRYNECVATNQCVINDYYSDKQTFYHDRTKYVVWELLNKENRETEMLRWLDGKRSVIWDTKIEVDWVEKNFPHLLDRSIKKILRGSHQLHKKKIIKYIPKELMHKYADTIKDEGNDVYISILSNRYAPKEHVINALKIASKRKNWPLVNVKIDKSILESLAPVTRLNVLESIMNVTGIEALDLGEITSKEDLDALLFGVSIKHRYYHRVAKLVDTFQIMRKRFFEEKEKNEHI